MAQSYSGRATGLVSLPLVPEGPHMGPGTKETQVSGGPVTLMPSVRKYASSLLRGTLKAAQSQRQADESQGGEP